MKQTWDCNYPFGIDPGWYGTKNELTFLNSFKMKLAIVLGVAHMIFGRAHFLINLVGILLKGVNSIHFGLWVDFIFEFIPQLVFMSLTFG
jgi:V-type H+-transporting ATPase subunit a